jgi:hypothetical protein
MQLACQSVDAMDGEGIADVVLKVNQGGQQARPLLDGKSTRQRLVPVYGDDLMPVACRPLDAGVGLGIYLRMSANGACDVGTGRGPATPDQIAKGEDATSGEDVA